MRFIAKASDAIVIDAYQQTRSRGVCVRKPKSGIVVISLSGD